MAAILRRDHERSMSRFLGFLTVFLAA
jgi:hypothetical protein